MSRPFSLYLTTEVPSVAVNPESFCAAESHSGTIFAKWQIEWLSLPASPFCPAQTLISKFVSQEVWKAEEPGALCSMGLSPEPVTFWWENRGKERYMPLCLCKGILWQARKSWGRSKPGLLSARQERRALSGNRVASSVWQWEYLLPLSACHGDGGLNESIAGFLMSSVVSSRRAKNISCNGD